MYCYICVYNIMKWTEFRRKAANVSGENESISKLFHIHLSTAEMKNLPSLRGGSEMRSSGDCGGRMRENAAVEPFWTGITALLFVGLSYIYIYII